MYSISGSNSTQVYSKDCEINYCFPVFKHGARLDRMSCFILWTYFCHIFPYVFVLYFVTVVVIRQIRSKKMRWTENVARMGDERKMYKVLLRNSEGKRPFGRPTRR
jgi:hypothetical protein